MWLLQAEDRYEISQMGPDFFILKKGQPYPRLGEATAAMQLDADAPQWFPVHIDKLEGVKIHVSEPKR